MSARWQRRFLWRRVKCALGFHGWMLGPYDRDGNVVWVGGEKIARSDPRQQRFVYETCCFGWPWCDARRVSDRETFRWKR